MSWIRLVQYVLQFSCHRISQSAIYFSNCVFIYIIYILIRFLKSNSEAGDEASFLFHFFNFHFIKLGQDVLAAAVLQLLKISAPLFPRRLCLMVVRSQVLYYTAAGTAVCLHSTGQFLCLQVYWKQLTVDHHNTNTASDYVQHCSTSRRWNADWPSQMQLGISHLR